MQMGRAFGTEWRPERIGRIEGDWTERGREDGWRKKRQIEERNRGTEETGNKHRKDIKRK